MPGEGGYSYSHGKRLPTGRKGGERQDGVADLNDKPTSRTPGKRKTHAARQAWHLCVPV